MTELEIESAVASAIRSGRWMIRTDDDGVSHGGFRWNPVGEWTEPEVFSAEATCDSGGLFGQARRASGFGTRMSRVVFCRTGGRRITVGGDKIKTDRAMILLVNDLSSARGLRFEASLYLAKCTGLTSLPEGLSVEGYLNLEGCTGLTSLPEGLSVGGCLNLYGCTGLTSLPGDLSVGGDLYMRGCTGLTSLPEGLSVGGILYLPEHLRKLATRSPLPPDGLCPSGGQADR